MVQKYNFVIWRLNEPRVLIENGANIKGANKGMSCLGLKGAKNQGAKIRVQTRMMDFGVQNIRVQKIRVQTVVGYLGSNY